MENKNILRLMTKSALLLSAFSVGGVLAESAGINVPLQTIAQAASAPTIWGVHPGLVSDGQQLNLLHGIEAHDETDGDISRNIKVSHNIDYNKNGTYDVTYSVTNSQGQTATAKTTVTVQLPNWRQQLDQLGYQANRVENNLNELKDKLPDQIVNEIQPQIKGINDKIRELSEKDRLLADDLEELRARITQAEKNIDGLKGADQELAYKIGVLKVILGK